jgi:hypothetical protein
MNEEPLHRFHAELERWARRPPERSATVARGRVLARLGSRSGAHRWQVPAAALLLAALALGLSLSLPRREPIPPPARLDDRLIVFQLQSGTKVYFALPPEGSPKGDLP